ncbi:methyltransferase [Alkalihalobacillus alcalophilus ATCC 27647 = CGMCC 1.3604]|uniref:Methyltransferase n=1 Tax=Alkalihalobacillus alcalophilus ATCC 27647 = CGMCC 1.3604 TaxID=1218173 RepID=A0A094XHS7_ALKAL|nr:class I SAM-dependent methyltransferase [Alkalihalobacillus alcalophilus]KGA98325.1 16S rRNA methyltransferase [Alkalihalobacillus alcalophilus ATCC 27647 = CGMCC 1.3604]MED1561643.1 class I SAM-dependent methyltransferase [Alkalihalobacillus alcalophilus]THG89921.1 methyltransferase [Alkalihalobacillus alcalophilus ATCC 27647 = CGMCC 1.3604]
MSEHYYSNKPTTESDEKKWSTTLCGFPFSFTTDRGVFSKGEVDFGSRFLLEELTTPIIEGDILDVGCGYGPIGLTIAKKHPTRTVCMVDVNERALELARRNALNNHVENVSIFVSDSLAAVEPTDFAMIVTNPPIRAGKKVVHDILARAYEHLATNGELWVVIQKKQGAPSAVEKLERVFGNCSIVKKKKGYYLLVAKKID